MLRLPEDKRHFFREPFGTLYRELEDIVPSLSGRKVYTVGDIVTYRALAAGIKPAVAVIDGHTMRTPCNRSPVSFPLVIRAKNPPGTITEELMRSIKAALENTPALVVVEGEEDLAVIPLVLSAPPGGVVLYGQPGEGVVLRELDDEARIKAKMLLSCFEDVNEDV